LEGIRVFTLIPNQFLEAFSGNSLNALVDLTEVNEFLIELDGRDSI